MWWPNASVVIKWKEDKKIRVIISEFSFEFCYYQINKIVHNYTKCQVPCKYTDNHLLVQIKFWCDFSHETQEYFFSKGTKKLFFSENTAIEITNFAESPPKCLVLSILKMQDPYENLETCTFPYVSMRYWGPFFYENRQRLLWELTECAN